MRIYEWADRLGMDGKKSRGPEDFWALCPCHSDQHPSLHVYIGGNTGEIVMHCFVCGANGGQVCEALNLPLSEVMCDARTGEPIRRTASAAAPKKGKTAKSCRRLKIGDTWQERYRVTTDYAYAIADGTVMLHKYRAEEYGEDGARTAKTFTIQHQGADGKWYWGAGIYAGLLYHLPEVIEGVRRAERILIAEGEKDVDNLRKLGYNATCGMHGGGTSQLHGKWNEDHAKHFDGAQEVIVIADNDAAGEGIAQWICKSLRERVKSLKLVRISEHYPELPAHGDFTDWVEMLKGQGVSSKSAVHDMLEAMFDRTPQWAPGHVRSFGAEDGGTAQAGADAQDAPGAAEEEYPAYHGSRMYCVKNGCLAVRNGQAGARVLCDFLPEPKEIIHRDDGSTKRTDYVIAATTASGARLPDAVVEGSATFAGMKWLMDAWDHYGNCKVIKNAEQMVRDAINTAGQRVSLHRDVYEHTGIRMIEGKPCYLYNGGAIGARNVSVELTGVLKKYNLDDCGLSRREAAEAELTLLDMLPGRVVYPQLAQCYLAPLYSVMEAMQQPPSYVVMVIGGSNAGKSTVASYCLAHFGSFYNRQFPATFEGTVNAERDKLFWLKDCLLVVDDYRKGDGGGRNPHDMIANTLISAVADRSDRTRLDEKKKQSAPRPCRAVCIMTAEELPKISTSRQTRIYRIDVEIGDIYKKDARELEPLRLMAKGGYYRQCMRYYIEDLLARWDGIESEMDDRIEAASARMHKLIARRKEGRMLECAAHLMVGVGLMLDHLQRCGMMDEAEKQRRMDEAAQSIAQNIEEQGRGIDESRPEEIWLQTLRSLMATRSVYLMDKDELMRTGFRAGVIGFEEDGIVNLDPHACDEYIGERLRKGGESLNAGRPAILRALAKAGRIRYKPKEDGSGVAEYTFPTRIGRTRPRMIQMYRWALDGEDPPTPREQGFTPIEGEQEKMPF